MFNGILAQSPFIIFKPGGVPNAITVTKWSDVQAFIALRKGAVTVYVDDSVAPAHVPAASGVTDCQGRVEIRPYRPDTNNFSNLTVDDGATLKSLARISGTIFLVCDTRGAVPGLDFDYSPNVLGTPVPTFFIEDFAALGTAATCTQSPIIVPAANSLVLSFNTRGNIFMQSAAYLVTLAAATSNVTIAATDAEICGPGSPNSNLITGPGGCTYQFDLPTSSPQLSAVPPVFTVGTLRKQLLDMSIQSVVFKPGVPSSGTSVATWAEVQDFIATRNGQVIVYVDASVAAAHVPAASGVTDCLGRVELRPYRQDSNNFTTLTVDSGATLKSLYRLAGTIFLQLDTQGAVPALDFDYTGAAFPTLYVEDQAAIGTSTTANQPACIIPAGQELNWWVTSGAEVIAQTASAIVQVSAGSTFGVFARNANFVSTAGSIPSTWAQGPGRFTMGYDANTARESNTPGTVLGPGINFTNVATSITVAIDGDPNVLGSTTQTVYVSKSGSDVSGNGSRSFPYLTIQKALTSITDATVNKRYNIEVGVGEYADPFLMKPWVGISGTKQTSGFYGLTEITAPADTVGYDPVAYGPAGFSVAWLSHLVFANHQTWNQTTAGNQRVQLTCFDVNFNNAFSFIGDGTGGVDNYTLDDCLVYGGGLAQGIQFLFTIGGTQFQGGTVTIQAAPNAAAAESTTWLAQNTAVGATFNPTAVHVLWAAPTPAARQAKLDWNNTNAVGQINLDGANVVATITGVRPANIIQSNGAPAAVVQPITITQTFLLTTPNIFAALQAAGKLPTTGNALVLLDGWGGGGGGAGGGISGGAGPAVGGAGGGGATRKSAQVIIDLSHSYDANIGLGGNGGTGNNPTGANGNAGSETSFADSAGPILVAFDGGQGGTANFANTQNHALTTAIRGVPGAADLVYAPDLPANTTIAPAAGRASPATAPACGGYAQALAADTFAGSGSPSSALNVSFGGGNGGRNAIGAGTLSFAGGGGGGGPGGPGGAGGDSVGPGAAGNNGVSGGAVNLNSGAGGGGGSAASSNLFSGGLGGSGGRGFLSVTVIVQ